MPTVELGVPITRQVLGSESIEPSVQDGPGGMELAIPSDQG